MLKDEDIECEYPSDVDDEYVTESGFQPTLPGESTRLSSSLALFRVSRILARVLEQNYPVSNSQDLSLLGVSALDEELDAWYNNLAPHLKLEFVQDKPSTHVISSRCPLLVSYGACHISIYAHTNMASVSDVSVHSCSDSPSCRIGQSWRQGRIQRCSFGILEQAHHPDSSVVGRAELQLIALPQQE